MNKIKKIINKETVLYLFFGVMTTIVDFVSYIILKNLSVNYLIANVIAWVIAVIFAYVTNKFFVFNSKNADKETVTNELLDFLSARIFSLAFSLVFIYAAVTLLDANDIIAKVISSVFVVIINYVLSKFFIFSGSSDEDENRKKGIISTLISENLSYIVAFLIPLIILIVIYYMRDIYPFGDNMYLRSDCYHQYAPFLMEFYNKITTGGDLTYSWNIGLGVNFSALYAYYLASPLNWIIGLFSAKYITEIMSVFIILKTALSGFTFSYYISKHFNSKKISIAALAVFYALSSYFCAFSWNIMWLDCLLLLPLIALGLERLVKENKCYLYCISLGIAILSNYYIGIMLCIFCVIYYCALLYMDSAEKTLTFLFKKTKNFVIYSLLAGGIAAISFIPAYCALSSTASGEFKFPKKIETYFSILDMLSRSLMNVEPAVFSAHDPNVYCSVIVFLLIPLYVINSKINFKEKIAKCSILALLLVSFNTNVPNYIWHGFHYPNSLPARESFIYIFMILVMSYEGLLYVKEITGKQLISCFAGAVAVILLIEELYVSDTYSSMTIYLSLLFIIFYVIVISLYRNNNFKQNFVAYLLLIMVASEAFINADETAISTCTRSAYMNDNKAIEKLIDKADKNEDENSFYRIEKEYRRSKNDAAWSDYFGASIFSSTTNAGLSEYYGSLGFEESTNAYAYYGHTPLTEAMFSIKYVLSTIDIPANKYRTLFSTEKYTDSFNTELTYHMYKNNYCLPLGFMMPELIEERWDNTNPNPFVVQNALADAILGSDDKENYSTNTSNTNTNNTNTSNINTSNTNVNNSSAAENAEANIVGTATSYTGANIVGTATGYVGENNPDINAGAVTQGGNKVNNNPKMYTRLNVNTIGEENEIYLDSDTHLFIYVTTSLDGITIRTETEGMKREKNYSSMTHRHILDLGEQTAGTTVTVFSNDDEVPSIQLYAYSFDDEIFEKVYNKLNESTLEITSFDDTVVKGKIDVKKEGLMYTSIPYDEGWKVYVDGKEVKTHAFKKALLSFDLDKGEHDITFEYAPKGLNIGIIATLTSSLILIAVIIADILKKKHNKEIEE